MPEKREEEFLEAATAIGARLCRDALWDGPRCNWLGPSMEFIDHQWRVAHRSFGPDLYGGTSGIALFLGRLYRLTTDRIFRRTAEGAARQAQSRLDAIAPETRIGFFSGWTGIAYVLAELGEILDQEAFVSSGLQILKELTDGQAGHSKGTDVISGSAGAIPSLLDLHGRYPDAGLLELAVSRGEQLLAAAKKNGAGWSWNTVEVERDHDLTGYSHGAAGIALALLELYSRTKEVRFAQAAEQGFGYERQWFSPQYENWPDFRKFGTSAADSPQQPSYSSAWCHGAPGIGLSRLRAYSLTGKVVYRQEAEAALRTTARSLQQDSQPTQGNYSLCHGFGGNAETLLQASDAIEESNWSSIAFELGRRGIEQYHSRRVAWPCGVLGSPAETPSLMLGVAGIGHFYLRLYDLSATPSILLIIPRTGESPTILGRGRSTSRG